jgi:hypothetical protein
MNLNKEQLAELSAWAAVKCGVKETTVTTYSGFIDCSVEGFNFDDKSYAFKWDIRDARCMEFLEDKFKILIERSTQPSGYYAHAHLESNRVFGKTHKLARINCLWAVFEGERG